LLGGLFDAKIPTTSVMPEHSQNDEISTRRARIHAQLIRANRAALGIFIAVILLAITIVFAALKAQENAREALDAKAAAQLELWRAQVAQARALRQSVAVGRAVEAWRAITNAAAFERNLELRNEAIAVLATPDIRQLPLAREFAPYQQTVTFDATGARYLETTSNGVVTLKRTSDNTTLWTVPAEEGKNWFDTMFGQSGRWLCVPGKDGALSLWDLSSYTKFKSYTNGQFWSYSLSGDDKFFCVSQPDGIARLYTLADWSETARLTGLTRDDDLTLNHDGSSVAVASAAGNNIRIIDWRRPTNIVQFTPPTHSFAVDWHPDGSQIAVAGQDQRIRVYDSRTGEELRALVGHHAQPVQLHFVAGRPWLLSMSWDGTSRLWDTVSGEELVRLPRYGDATFMNQATRQFGWRFQNNSVLELFQIEPPSVVRTFPDSIQRVASRPIQCAISPDERLLAIASSDGVRLLNPEDGKSICFREFSEANELGFLADGSPYVGLGKKFLRLNATNLEPSEVPGISGEKFRPSADGSVIASLDGQRISVWRGGKILQWDARQEGLETIALSADGKWLATGTRNHIGLRVWDAATGHAQWTNDFRHGAGVAFSADGHGLLAAGTEGCTLFEAASGWKIWERPRGEDTVHGIRVAASPDGKLVAVAHTWTEAMLLDATTGTELATLKTPNPRYINFLNFSGNGRFLAVTFEDRSIQLWDLKRLRTELAGVGLDWGTSGPPPSPAPLADSPRLLRYLLALAAAGVLAAIVFGISAFARHRQLLRGYLDIEAVAVQRQEQLHNAEKELVRGQKMTALGTLAAGVAHDFNNLLSVIRMANTGIARATQRPPEIADDLQDIESAVVDGKRIVQSMLGYTRDGLGPAEDFEIGPLLEECVRLLSRQYSPDIQMHLEIDRDLPVVHGYPGRLRQMLLNLVVNASEAMNGRGEIWIEAALKNHSDSALILRPSQAPRYLRVSIRDNGPGIEPQVRARIFEPFFTTKTSATIRGTGLGLSLVYTMAEQDGLGLDCQSAPGQGATFTIIFPVTASAGSRSPISTTAA
jgi:signal transduction histidine kinase